MQFKVAFRYAIVCIMVIAIPVSATFISENQEGAVYSDQTISRSDVMGYAVTFSNPFNAFGYKLHVTKVDVPWQFRDNKSTDVFRGERKGLLCDGPEHPICFDKKSDREERDLVLNNDEHLVDQGNTGGDSPNNIPEPSVMYMMIAGLLCAGRLCLRRNS